MGFHEIARIRRWAAPAASAVQKLKKNFLTGLFFNLRAQCVQKALLFHLRVFTDENPLRRDHLRQIPCWLHPGAPNTQLYQYRSC